MNVNVDARGSGASGTMAEEGAAAASSRQAQLPKVRTAQAKGTHARIAALKLESSLEISPHSPLVSTALQENGWVCGQSPGGLLGLGPRAAVPEPAPLPALRLRALALGGGHAAAVGDGGDVFTWGANSAGQLGAAGGPAAAPGGRDAPAKMDVLHGWDVRGVAAGAAHVVATTPHDVITWGANAHGQCGHGERAEVEWVKPRSLKVLHAAWVTQVVCGAHHTLCVTATSVVYAWGRNDEGQLGLGDAADRRSPAVVEALWALPVLQLAAGEAHSAALTSNGFLFTWGSDAAGQLGLPPGSGAAAAALRARTASERRRAARRVNQRFLQAMTEMGIPRDRAELALAETGNVGVEVAAEWLYCTPADAVDARLAGEPGTPHEEVGAGGSTPPAGAPRVLAPRRVALRGVRAVAAGRGHTVAVTDEEVYAWGAGGEGQLGTRGWDERAPAPAEVSDLAGRGVCQVACGATHTLFACRDGAVFGCGAVGGGALPLGPAGVAGMLEPGLFRGPAAAPTHVAAPVPLRLAFVSGEGAKAPVVSAAIAGDRCSAFLTRSADELPDAPPPRLWEQLQAAVAEARAAPRAEPEHIAPIAAAVERVFGSAAAISAAFGQCDEVGIDVAALEAVQAAIWELEAPPPAAPPPAAAGAAAPAASGGGSAAAAGSAAASPERTLSCASGASGARASSASPERASPGGASAAGASAGGPPAPPRDAIYAAFRRAADALIADLERNIRLLGTPERAQVLLAALQSHLLGDARAAGALIPRVCQAVLAAPPSARRLLVKWWAECPADLLEARVVRPLQRYLTDELYATKKLTVSVMNAIKVLAKVEEANQIGRRLPPEAFYNELISEKLDVLDHYVAWRQTHDMPAAAAAGADGPFSFCSYPFLLNPRAKSKLLHTEARIQMDQTVAASRLEAQLEGGGGGALARGGRAPEAAQDCVVPPVKRRPGGAGSAPGSDDGGDGGGRAGERRRDRHGGGLRWLFGAARGGAAAPASPRDPPRPARDGYGTRHYDAGAAAAGGSAAGGAAAGAAGAPGAKPGALPRQNSINLPCPEDSGFPATHPDMCIVRIRRNHLLEDALSEVARQRPRDLFKPLRVHFIGEDGVDAGGVKKEFFQLLVAELLCPDYGMLSHQPESNTYWFNPATFESDAEFLLLGLTVGLAIYNGVLLDLPLPLALYRKLLGQEVRLRDLEDMQPTLGRSLRQLLQYEGPGAVEDVFCQSFAVEVPGFGETRLAELAPGGAAVPVTEDNRAEFVDAYVAFVMDASVHAQFEAFARGFLMLCGGPALQLFSATELERLVCGNPVLDFDGLVRSARYEGGFHAEHRVVQWLWAVVAELSRDEQKRFLKFFTGSDRAPIGGLGNLRCVVQRDGPDANRLPTSHTCFNTLLLPSYRSKEKLEERLRLAILNSEGFGLE